MSDQVTDVVERLVSEHGGAILSAASRGDLPRPVLEAAGDVCGNLSDTLAIGRQLEADLAELEARRDLLPVDGFRRLRADAIADAKKKLAELEPVTDRAVERLEVSLQDAVMPTFQPSREQLSRDECSLALGFGNPELAAHALARDGSPEALAALLSPWGRTVLRARGVHDVDRVIREVRQIAIAQALKRGDSPAALALSDHLGALKAAKGSAGSLARRLGAKRFK